jgi:U3 small nucleolar RNA-associated protein 11
MSSFKKASKTNQRTHRERHQPKAREKLGFLEKKQDYQLRAQDRHDKEDTLKLLHKKALNKNPDEFYHHMINSKLQKDEHFEKDKDEELTPEQKKLMDTQDKKYIIMKRTIERRKIQRLQEQLHLVDDPKRLKKSKHTIFDDEGQVLKRIDIKSRLERMKSKIDGDTLQKLNAEREKNVKELERRKQRERDLASVQRKFEQKNLSKSQRKGVKPKEMQRLAKSSAEIFKFKYQRKK